MTMQATKKLPTREQLAELSRKARAFYEPLREKLEKEHWSEHITIPSSPFCPKANVSKRF